MIGDDGHVSPQAVDGGSGGVIPPYVITPLQAINDEAARMYAKPKPLHPLILFWLEGNDFTIK